MKDHTSRHSDVIRKIVDTFILVDREMPTLLPVARWYFASSQLAAAFLEKNEPTAQELRTLLSLLQQQDEELADLFRDLTTRDSKSETVLAKLLLEELCRDPGAWEHPSQLLPRPPLQTLLSLIQERLRVKPLSKPERQRLLVVKQKVERAYRVARAAARRRKSGGLLES